MADTQHPLPDIEISTEAEADVLALQMAYVITRAEMGEIQGEGEADLFAAKVSRRARRIASAVIAVDEPWSDEDDE
jgi:hypothetical protein